MLHFSKNGINMTWTFVFGYFTLFSLDDVGDFLWPLWCLVSGSYSKISCFITSYDSRKQVWFSLMTLNDVLIHLYKQSSWSSFRGPGTILALILCIPKSSVIIFQVLSFFISCWLTIIRAVNQWLPHTTCLSKSTLSSVQLVEGLPLLESSFTPLWISMKLLCYSKTRVRYLVIFLFVCWSISSVCDRVFPNRTKKFMFIRYSAFIVCSAELTAEPTEKRWCK